MTEARKGLLAAKLAPKVVTELGIVNDASAVPLNAYVPIEVTPDGIEPIFVNDGEAKKRKSGIAVIPLGKTAFSNFAQA